MPIYAYRCADCGHAQDFLQKISDGPIAACPSCGSAQFQKQVTAAGFQLKGGGWYVTDFRDSGKKDGKKSDAAAESKTETKSDAKPADGAAAAPSTTTASPAASTTSSPSSGGDTKVA